MATLLGGGLAAAASPEPHVITVGPPESQRAAPPGGEADGGTRGAPAQQADHGATVRGEDRAALQAAMEQTRAATARAEALERQVSALQAAQARDAQRITALEGQLSAERGRREQAERDRAATARDLSTASGGLGGASAALASGSTSDVARDLAQAQSLAAAAAQRAAQGSPEQSAAAAAAQRSLAASQQALQEGDLFRARVGLNEAQQAIDRARASPAPAGAPAQ